MALATTCPQCRTRFRVTPAQLQQRAGRVRCGICRHAFDALKELDELDDPAEGVPGTPRPPGTRADASQAMTPHVDTEDVDTQDVDTDGTDAGGVAPPGPGAAPDPADPTAHGALPGELPDAFRKLLDEWPSALDWPAPAGQPGTMRATSAAPGDVASSATPVPDATSAPAGETGPADRPATDPRPEEGTPSTPASMEPMLRRPSADIDAVGPESVPAGAADLPRFGVPTPAGDPAASPWRRPLVTLAVALLAIAALLQAALLGRHALAAREPALRPALQALAGMAGLRVDLPRRLSQLTLEGFDLQATGPEGRLALTAVLRNRGGVPVQWPALELTLTDEGGGVVVRRALLPVEYLRGSGASLDDGMPARSELPIRMLLDAPLTRSAGYAVDLFYP